MAVARDADWHASGITWLEPAEQLDQLDRFAVDQLDGHLGSDRRIGYRDVERPAVAVLGYVAIDNRVGAWMNVDEDFVQRSCPNRAL